MMVVEWIDDGGQFFDDGGWVGCVESERDDSVKKLIFY